MAGRGIAALPLQLLEDDARLGDAEAAAAVRLGDQRREPAGLGQRFDELARVALGPVDLAPVRIPEPGADLRDRRADVGVPIGGHERARASVRRAARATGSSIILPPTTAMPLPSLIAASIAATIARACATSAAPGVNPSVIPG